MAQRSVLFFPGATLLLSSIRTSLGFSAVNLLQPEKDFAVPARPGDLPGHRAERPEGAAFELVAIGKDDHLIAPVVPETHQSGPGQDRLVRFPLFWDASIDSGYRVLLGCLLEMDLGLLGQPAVEKLLDAISQPLDEKLLFVQGRLFAVEVEPFFPELLQGHGLQQGHLPKDRVSGSVLILAACGGVL